MEHLSSQRRTFSTNTLKVPQTHHPNAVPPCDTTSPPRTFLARNRHKHPLTLPTWTRSSTSHTQRCPHMRYGSTLRWPLGSVRSAASGDSATFELRPLPLFHALSSAYPRPSSLVIPLLNVHVLFGELFIWISLRIHDRFSAVGAMFEARLSSLTWKCPLMWCSAPFLFDPIALPSPSIFKPVFRFFVF